jgi:hypothetical protein
VEGVRGTCRRTEVAGRNQARIANRATRQTRSLHGSRGSRCHLSKVADTAAMDYFTPPGVALPRGLLGGIPARPIHRLQLVQSTIPF